MKASQTFVETGRSDGNRKESKRLKVKPHTAFLVSLITILKTYFSFDSCKEINLKPSDFKRNTAV